MACIFVHLKDNCGIANLKINKFNLLEIYLININNIPLPAIICSLICATYKLNKVFCVFALISSESVG